MTPSNVFVMLPWKQSLTFHSRGDNLNEMSNTVSKIQKYQRLTSASVACSMLKINLEANTSLIPSSPHLIQHIMNLEFTVRDKNMPVHNWILRYTLLLHNHTLKLHDFHSMQFYEWFFPWNTQIFVYALGEILTNVHKIITLKSLDTAFSNSWFFCIA